jgi:hypothetical protein
MDASRGRILRRASREKEIHHLRIADLHADLAKHLACLVEDPVAESLREEPNSGSYGWTAHDATWPAGVSWDGGWDRMPGQRPILTQT